MSECFSITLCRPLNSSVADSTIYSKNLGAMNRLNIDEWHKRYGTFDTGCSYDRIAEFTE